MLQCFSLKHNNAKIKSYFICIFRKENGQCNKNGVMTYPGRLYRFATLGLKEKVGYTENCIILYKCLI